MEPEAEAISSLATTARSFGSSVLTRGRVGPSLELTNAKETKLRSNWHNFKTYLHILHCKTCKKLKHKDSSFIDLYSDF